MCRIALRPPPCRVTRLAASRLVSNLKTDPREPDMSLNPLLPFLMAGDPSLEALPLMLSEA
ncbi:MAG TPA: hypothetical protein VJ549_01745, partial [Geothrix sp.]|nr:hypothetical protein [Geothrix sp.]